MQGSAKDCVKDSVDDSVEDGLEDSVQLPLVICTCAWGRHDGPGTTRRPHWSQQTGRPTEPRERACVCARTHTDTHTKSYATQGTWTLLGLNPLYGGPASREGEPPVRLGLPALADGVACGGGVTPPWSTVQGRRAGAPTAGSGEGRPRAPPLTGGGWRMARSDGDAEAPREPARTVGADEPEEPGLTKPTLTEPVTAPGAR